MSAAQQATVVAISSNNLIVQVAGQEPITLAGEKVTALAPELKLNNTIEFTLADDGTVKTIKAVAKKAAEKPAATTRTRSPAMRPGAGALPR